MRLPSLKKIILLVSVVAISLLTIGTFSYLRPSTGKTPRFPWISKVTTFIPGGSKPLQLGPSTELECPEASLRGKLLSGTWPLEIVPIYPNAHDLEGQVNKPSKLIAPDCAKIIYQYGLQADSDTGNNIYSWYKNELLTRGFKITQDTVGYSAYEDNLGNKVIVTTSFSAGPNVTGFVGLHLTLELKKSPLGKCPEGDKGQAGESCQNASKCDIAGGCNPACCSKESDCPNNQKCNIDNGYCRSGLSCNPQTGN